MRAKKAKKNLLDYEIGRIICEYITGHELVSYECNDVYVPEDLEIYLDFNETAHAQIGAKIKDLLGIDKAGIDG